MELGYQSRHENPILIFTISFWLGLNIIFPGQFSALKSGLTFVLMLISIIKILLSNKLVNFGLLKTVLIFLFLIILSLFNGYFRGFSVNFEILSIYILRPIAIYLIISLITTRKKFNMLITYINIIALLLSLYNILFILGAFGIIPQLFVWETDNVVIANQSFIAARLTNQAALTFFIPYIYHMLLKKDKLSKFNLRTLQIAIVLGTVAGLLSGRRVLQIVVILSMLVYFFYLDKRTIKKILIRIFFVFLLFIILNVLNNLLSSLFGLENIFNIIWLTIKDAFNTETHSGNIRNEQIQILLNEAFKVPFFGSGVNSFVPYYIRSIGTPWSYEFMYVAYLMQIGFLGCTFVGVYVFHILKKMYKNVIPDVSGYFDRSVFWGSISFIMSGFTNPMILSIWFWFMVALVTSFKGKNIDNKL